MPKLYNAAPATTPTRSPYGPASHDPADVLESSPQKKLVLVVEDDFLLRTSIAEFLEYNGCRVEAAADGLEALMWLDATVHKPAVILLDITMPRMDGIRFLSIQRSLSHVANIPAIAITGTGARRSNLAALGFRDVFFKPIDLSKLLLRVQAL